MQFFIYLLNLHKQSRRMALLVWIFIFFQGYFTYKNRQVFPFVNWGMFSEAAPEKTLYNDYLFLLNGKVFHIEQLSMWRQNILSSKISYYRLWQENEKTDPWKKYIQPEFHFIKDVKIQSWLEDRLTNKTLAAAEFEVWLTSFFKKISNTDVQDLKVYYITYRYNEKMISLEKAKTIIQYQSGK